MEQVLGAPTPPSVQRAPKTLPTEWLPSYQPTEQHRTAPVRPQMHGEVVVVVTRGDDAALWGLLRSLR
jgi:hypothetical protein